MGDIQNELRRKGRIELGDKIMLYGGEWMLLQQGDTYVAQVGNEPPEILTMRRREVQKRRRGDAEGKIFPKERKKPLFNLHEVVKVTIIDNPNPPKEPKNDERQDGAGAVPVPGPERLRDGGTPAEERPEPRQDGPQPRQGRPVPGPPRRGGRTDYQAAAAKRAAEDAGADVGGSGSGGSGEGDAS